MPCLAREEQPSGMSWFHGKISREEAEELLVPREDGLFLVRESANFPGDYTLCVSFEGDIQYYRIEIAPGGKMTIDNIDFFDNLDSLIDHYLQDADGLCTQLTKCIPRPDNLAAFRQEGLIIDSHDILIGEAIGKGEFGDVLLGTIKKDGRKVAVKTRKDATRAAHEFLAEASVMKSLQHKNLVTLIGIVVGKATSTTSNDSGAVSLVFEFMAKGSLVDYLRSRGRQHVTRMVQIDFACDVCEGMKYLESKRVVHRDLAARNVLINDRNVAKISDFGLAQSPDLGMKSHTDPQLVSSKLPIKWTAPEALKNSVFSSKSDMWSFGVLLWEIYSYGRIPYPRIPLDDVVKQVTEHDYRMPAPEGCPPDVAKIMEQAWHKLPENRPTFSETLKKLNYIRKLERSNSSNNL